MSEHPLTYVCPACHERHEVGLSAFLTEVFVQEADVPRPRAERWSAVLSGRFGGTPRPRTAVAAGLGVTSARAAQLEHDAIRALLGVCRGRPAVWAALRVFRPLQRAVRAYASDLKGLDLTD